MSSVNDLKTKKEQLKKLPYQDVVIQYPYISNIISIYNSNVRLNTLFQAALEIDELTKKKRKGKKILQHFLSFSNEVLYGFCQEFQNT